jgi:hypothetical protein
MKKSCATTPRCDKFILVDSQPTKVWIDNEYLCLKKRDDCVWNDDGTCWGSPPTYHNGRLGYWGTLLQTLTPIEIHPQEIHPIEIHPWEIHDALWVAFGVLYDCPCEKFIELWGVERVAYMWPANFELYMENKIEGNEIEDILSRFVNKVKSRINGHTLTYYGVMDSLPCEIVEHIIGFAYCDKFVIISEEPVEFLEHEWEQGKWVPFWNEYSRKRHLRG